MSARERMHIVLERGKADRIPVALVADSDYQCQAAGIDHREFRFGGNRVRAEVQRRYWLRHKENDFLLCWSGVSRDFTKRYKLTRLGDRYVVADIQTGEVKEVEKWKTGADPHRGLTSRGCSTPITRETDIERVMGPRPTPEEVLASGRYDPLCSLKKTLGGSAFLAMVSGGVFPGTIDYLGGFERAMETLRTNPSLVAAVVEELAHREAVNIRAAARFRPDASWQSAYLEGADLISPKQWRELIKPGHRIMVDEAKRHGMKVLFWFLGDCMPLLDDIVELGVDGLVVEQPRRGYSSDPGEIRAIVGKSICVYGWSPELAMIRGDRAVISRTIEQQIRDAGLDGAFIMGSTYLTNEVACETVDFFCKEVARLSHDLVG